VTRRLIPVLALAALLAVIAPAAAAAAKGVAVGAPGQTAFEFVGKADQSGPSWPIYGYLTYVRGLDDAQIFSVPGVDQSEATAKLTFSAATTVVRRAVIENVFAVTAVGSITVYLNPGGASFSDPSSFARGRVIATSTLRFQNIINVQSPAQAVSIGSGGAEQRSAKLFSLGGKQYRFGRVGLEERIFATGEGTLLEPTLPRSVVFLAGSASISK
jgi:hypothetical protein